MNTNTTAAEFGIAIDGTVTETGIATMSDAMLRSREVRAQHPGSRVAPVHVARFLSR